MSTIFSTGAAHLRTPHAAVSERLAVLRTLDGLWDCRVSGLAEVACYITHETLQR